MHRQCSSNAQIIVSQEISPCHLSPSLQVHLHPLTRSPLCHCPRCPSRLHHEKLRLLFWKKHTSLCAHPDILYIQMYNSFPGPREILELFMHSFHTARQPLSSDSGARSVLHVCNHYWSHSSASLARRLARWGCQGGETMVDPKVDQMELAGFQSTLFQAPSKSSPGAHQAIWWGKRACAAQIECIQR